MRNNDRPIPGRSGRPEAIRSADSSLVEERTGAGGSGDPLGGTRAARCAIAIAAILTGLLVAGCSGAPILANPPVVRPTPPEASPAPPRPGDPLPIELPRDDGPHDRLTEWWYVTGHLRDATGGRWGFEYVVFRAERGSFPVTWASHLALTDETGGRFGYAQRTEVGPHVAQPTDSGFSLAVRGAPGGAGLDEPAWRMDGADSAHLVAAARPDEVEGGIAEGFGLDLRVRAARPPVLHALDGWIDFGPAGGSYYYSRTRMLTQGTLVVGTRQLAVDGLAWFDHQWGDFISVGGGGWDWFAINLDDGTDLTLSLVRDADGSYPLVYGTLVEAAGVARHVPRDDFTIEVTDRWTSPHTGADYPAGWRITVPSETLEIELRPTVADQELDARESTGVVYWEGSQVVRARRGGTALGGEAYVELTGYAPAGLAAGD